MSERGSRLRETLRQRAKKPSAREGEGLALGSAVLAARQGLGSGASRGATCFAALDYLSQTQHCKVTLNLSLVVFSTQGNQTC